MAEREMWTSYDEYLQSKLWRRIRRRVLRRDAQVCMRCGGRANEVHHKSYDQQVMEGFADHELVSLCRGCHECIEIDEHGHKRPPAEVSRLLQTPAPTDVPPPAIRDRRRIKLLPAPNSQRLSAAQRAAYGRKAAAELLRLSQAASDAREERRGRHGRTTVSMSLYPDDQIIWALDAQFGNAPTAFKEMYRFMPDEVVDNPSYWLKKAGDDLIWHNPDCRSILKRVFSATPAAIKRVRGELAKPEPESRNPWR